LHEAGNPCGSRLLHSYDNARGGYGEINSRKFHRKRYLFFSEMPKKFPKWRRILAAISSQSGISDRPGKTRASFLNGNSLMQESLIELQIKMIKIKRYS
jgi:hypothetical protein